MATVETAVQTEPASSGYQFQGTLLEACNCDVLCPCWIGEDPDNGTCSSVVCGLATTCVLRSLSPSLTRTVTMFD